MRSTSAYFFIPFFFLQFVKATVTSDCNSHLVPCIESLDSKGHPKPNLRTAVQCTDVGRETEGILCTVDPEGSVDIICHTGTQDYAMTVKYTEGYGALSGANTNLFEWTWNLEGGNNAKSNRLNDLLIVACNVG